MASGEAADSRAKVSSLFRFRVFPKSRKVEGMGSVDYCFTRMNRKVYGLIFWLMACRPPFGDGCCQDQKAAPVKDPSPPVRLYCRGIPETGFLTLKTDNYTLPIDAASGWTIEKMFFKNHQFGLSNGHYGTVLIPKGGKWWGTGHKEGGREIVHALALTVDGKAVPIKKDGTVSGKQITLTKDSTIWKFKVRAEIALSNEFIYERTQMEALEDVETDTLYYFMHIFPTATTQWIACLPDGKTEQGPLRHAGNMQINKQTLWTAQFDPTVQFGYLCYTPKVIDGPKSLSMIWDLKRYHKYYLRQNKGEKFSKGEKLDFAVLVKTVPGENGDWRATKKAAGQLMERFPPGSGSGNDPFAFRPAAAGYDSSPAAKGAGAPDQIHSNGRPQASKTDL